MMAGGAALGAAASSAAGAAVSCREYEVQSYDANDDWDDDY